MPGLKIKKITKEEAKRITGGKTEIGVFSLRCPDGDFATQENRRLVVTGLPDNGYLIITEAD